MQNVSAASPASGLLSEIAAFFNVEYHGHEIQSLIPKGLSNLFLRPNVKLPFLSLAISIFSGVESPSWRCHIPQNVGENLPCRLSIVFFSGCLICLGVSHGQHSLIVKHFLKVGYK